MSQPTPYSKGFNFTNYATLNPNAPFQPMSLDTELNNIAQTLAGVLMNLALIQRDDGKIANSSIALEQLSSSVIAAMSNGWVIKGNWGTGVQYHANEIVTAPDLSTYIAVVDHVAGTFATDYAAGKWIGLAFNGTATRGNYLLSATAAATYETQSHASATYETAVHAAATYMTAAAVAAATVASALAIADGAVSSSNKLASKVVTFAKFQDVNNGKLVGRSSAGAGALEEISVGSGLALSGGTLSSTVSGGVSSFNGRAGVVTLASGDVTTALGYTPANGTFVAKDNGSLAVGSYVIGVTSGNIIANGGTVAGSLLKPACMMGRVSGSGDGASPGANAPDQIVGAALTGTWRNVSGIATTVGYYDGTANRCAYALWQRIA